MTSPFAGQGTILPLLASILAVCLVAGAMLSVATFSPASTPPTARTHRGGLEAPAHAAADEPFRPAEPVGDTDVAGFARAHAGLCRLNGPRDPALSVRHLGRYDLLPSGPSDQGEALR